jgi:hypothetical protein
LVGIASSPSLISCALGLIAMHAVLLNGS